MDSSADEKCHGKKNQSSEIQIGHSFITDVCDDFSDEETGKKSSFDPAAYLFDEVETTHTNHGPISSSEGSDKAKTQKNPRSSKSFDGSSNKTKQTILPLLQGSKKTDIDKLLEKSKVLNSDMSEPYYYNEIQLSKRKLKKLRKEEREKTKGDKWFGLPATELTEEVKRDLELMKMRSVLDPKHFYKGNHDRPLPKYFQIGKVQDSPFDFYNNRLTKKERKRTLVDELMADAEFNKYNKNKYAEILKEKQKTHYKAWRQAKRLKKK